jgi:predicted nuclease with TOPRIM domain
MEGFIKTNAIQLVVFVFFAGVTYAMLNNTINELNSLKQHLEDEVKRLEDEISDLRHELKDDVTDMEVIFSRRIGKYSQMTIKEAEEIIELKLKDKDLEHKIDKLK